MKIFEGSLEYNVGIHAQPEAGHFSINCKISPHAGGGGLSLDGSPHDSGKPLQASHEFNVTQTHRVRGAMTYQIHFARKYEWQISRSNIDAQQHDPQHRCILLCVQGHGSRLACPRVETGLLAVKAAVEPKKVVMAAMLMRECQV